ncbi:uncharacterized protein B0H18DRAFT_966886 [Fomitopsis serialis]|uniref:uncharacterized protein n=1 Tax=Fomitopsis serialis TaxID=139415 RepID=UPI0020075A53|nr:uncharacterized protein B0H18DRAFT_966886 [Neoantrodia serialis]KAH9938386.1 hypothetical protein B0H18DRAFT_966886 [Neoantrodia serialis]
MSSPQTAQSTHKSTSAPDVKALNQQKKQPPPPPPQNIKNKKEANQVVKPLPDNDPRTQPLPKNVARRSSKPIINWFQRKLAGTVRARRISDPDRPSSRPVVVREPSWREKPRRASAPQHPSDPPLSVRIRSKTESKHGRKISTVSSIPSRRPASLDGYSAVESTAGLTTDSDDGRRSSFARSSLWSPTSHLEADEDASMRPLPPTSPPSPSPSHSSSSYMSDPRTFRSMTASTKPTTLLSVDLTGGMAHIAQAPPTPTTPSRLQAHLRSQSPGPGSGGAITFSAIPPVSSGSPSPSASAAQNEQYALHAPQHTAHHPRNNPRPSSPPQDDASVLTLASSAFGMPGARIGMRALSLSGGVSVADDSISHLSHGVGAGGDSTSHFLLGELDDLLEKEYQDVDASVRALRPRSSRRGSWASEDSKWSASASLALTGVTGLTSLWTNGSYRTGGVSVDVSVSNDHGDDETDGNGEETEGEETSLDERVSVPDVRSLSTSVREIRSVSTHLAADDVSSVASPHFSVRTDDASTLPATPIDALGQQADALSTEAGGSSEPSKSAMATPKPGPISLQAHDAMPDISATIRSLGAVKYQEKTERDSAADSASVTTADYETDNFETPMTTPLPQPE